MRDADAVKKALAGTHAVYHFASMVGVGQSMYEIEQYTSVNNVGTAVLLEALARLRQQKVPAGHRMGAGTRCRRRRQAALRLAQRVAKVGGAASPRL